MFNVYKLAEGKLIDVCDPSLSSTCSSPKSEMIKEKINNRFGAIKCIPNFVISFSFWSWSWATRWKLQNFASTNLSFSQCDQICRIFTTLPTFYRLKHNLCLAKMLGYWAKFHCCKWQILKIKYWLLSVLVFSDMSQNLCVLTSCVPFKNGPLPASFSLVSSFQYR